MKAQEDGRSPGMDDPMTCASCGVKVTEHNYEHCGVCEQNVCPACFDFSTVQTDIKYAHGDGICFRCVLGVKD